MKFLPTVDLWDAQNQLDLLNGDLKLQTGQWVRCGSDQLSRFVCVTKGGSIWCVHPSPSITRSRFSECCQAWKVNKR